MRCAVRLLALPAAIALLASGSIDPLAQIAAANGHAATVHLRAFGERVVDGRHERATIDQLGVRRLVRTCVADACAGTWFDGRHVAAFGLNGVALPQDDDALTPVRRTLAAIASYAFAEPAFRAAGGVVEAVAPHVWRVRAVDGAPLVAELDPHTDALVRVTDDHGTIESFGKTDRAGGATYARERSGLQIEDDERVEALATGLAAPDGASATFDGSNTAALLDRDLPIVRCSLAGHPARCLLDSGSTPSSIALPFAETLGLEPRGEIEISGFSRFATGFVDAEKLTLGAAHFAAARFAVVPTAAGARFDVVVGADLLYRIRAVIDRKHDTARIDAPAQGAAVEVTPLTFAGGVPQIDVTLGGEELRAVLDTGDASTVSLGYATYRRGPQWPLVDRSQASGIGGAADAFVVAIPRVRLSGEELGPINAEVARTQERAHVGIGIWTRCAIELDESRGYFGCLRAP